MGVRPRVPLAAALAWSWVWWAASVGLGGTTTPAGAVAWIVGGLGPAVVVAAVLRRAGPEYRSSFRRQLLSWDVGWWWIAAVAVGVVPKLLAIGVAGLGGHRAAGEAISLQSVPVSVAFTIVVVLIEEPLWRGVALDGFAGSSVARAGLLIGVVWSAWHVPLFVVEGTFQHGLGLGTLDFWLFSVGVVGLSVLLTWLVVGSGGSIVLAMVAHGVVNLTGELLPDDTTVRAIEVAVVWVAAAVVVMRGRQVRHG